VTDERDSSGAPPVPPEEEPGEPDETTTGDELDEGIKESEAESEESRVDAAPREIT
jgi:hypothetical protein